MTKKHRSPLEYVALTSLALLVAAIAKYPNRAIFTRARPDLKEISVDGYPLFGNLIQALTNKENPLIVLNKAFQKRGDIYTITVPYRGRFFLVNHPMYIEYILKSRFVVPFFWLLVSYFYPPLLLKKGVFHQESLFLSGFFFLPLFPYFHWQHPPSLSEFVCAVISICLQLRTAL